MLAAQALKSLQSPFKWTSGSGAVRADAKVGSNLAATKMQAPKRAFGILSINQSQLRRTRMYIPQSHTVFTRGFLNFFKSKSKKVVQQADISPENPVEQTQYIKDISNDPPVVLNYFQVKDFAVNEEALKLYIRAIVTVSPELFNAYAKLPHLLESTSDGKTLRSREVAVPRDLLEDACENAHVTADSTLGLFRGLHKKTMAAMAAKAGATETAPIYVQVVKESKGWGRALVIFISGVFLAAVVFLFVPVLGMKPSSGMAGHFGLDMNFTTVEHPEQNFSDVKGYEEAKIDLQDLVLYLKNPEKFKRMNVTMPKGVLMVGPPGCGKTMLAKSLAGEAGVSFISVAGSQFEEMLVGVGASRVRKLFKTARSLAPCIIFIDEMDAVGEKREGPETRTKMTLNQLLIEMDGFKPNEGVIVIGATNIPKVLDPALTRSGRFDRMVTLELPDKRVRKEILEHYLKGKAEQNVNVDEIAALTTGCSGADLYNLVNLASIEVVKQDRNLITSELLHDALDTIRMGRKKTSQLMEEGVRKTTAYHEAGHALVALHTPGAKPVVKATLIPRGYSLGATHMLPHEDALQTLEQLNAELAVCMGGTVAEELIFGANKITTGASNDIEKATHIAKLMVTQFGMSKNIGKVTVNYDRTSSAQLHSLVDEEVRHLTEAAYKNAVKLLTDHQDELHTLAGSLLQKEVLSREEIMDLIQNLKHNRK